MKQGSANYNINCYILNVVIILSLFFENFTVVMLSYKTACEAEENHKDPENVLLLLCLYRYIKFRSTGFQ